VTVVGGGLAGCEAAWQLGEAGLDVLLLESKPAVMSPAHSTPTAGRDRLLQLPALGRGGGPGGLLKAELRRGGSLILACADATRVPAGEALAVDRHAFARLVTARIVNHPRIRLERRVVDDIPAGPTSSATGPLTGGRLARTLGQLCGKPLYFYDAIAPIVDAESIDRDLVFRASRFGHHRPEDGPEQGDYINCPLDREQYEAFVAAVRGGRKVLPHTFEEARYFEGCLPVEVMAERGWTCWPSGP
jgi:methylenetetrahydrofolate--tRNA-(uracil-5-)-methyltransferase